MKQEEKTMKVRPLKCSDLFCIVLLHKRTFLWISAGILSDD